MTNAWICDAVRTPIGRYGGALSAVRADDLGAIPIRALLRRNPGLAPDAIDDLLYGCANQAGEDNRNVARMSLLLAGLPSSVPGATVNRLCGSGMNAVGNAAHAIRAGGAGVVVAGGVESMSRAPFVMPKATAAFSRQAEIHDTTIGWRFVNRELMKAQYGIDSMPETAENVAEDFRFRARTRTPSRCAASSAAAAQENGALRQGDRRRSRFRSARANRVVVDTDEHPRAGSTLEALAKLRHDRSVTDGTVTAGNASGINDGSSALLLASDDAVSRHGLTPMASVVAWAAAGVEPRVMGIGPVPATRKLLARARPGDRPIWT
ncbi:MAG: acetyl-CoA C-acyltransferase [Woeseiaceae bacterium]|nr:acetyl-CoA C-acyltransferase [Woeseiaceae bacterium]